MPNQETWSLKEVIERKKKLKKSKAKKLKDEYIIFYIDPSDE